MLQNTYGIIMAGGVGSRFWPLSRNAKPKQFLDILGVGRTFIQQTYDRLSKLIPAENILVVTSLQYKQLVQEQLPQIKEENILLEPIRRNTAPCIAYATYKLLDKVSDDATIIVAPADHLILNEDEFNKTMVNAVNYAKTGDFLLTIGIKPTRPETGYGYIQKSENTCTMKHSIICKVKTFTEKPNLEMANVFLKSGEFLWNSGIFIWTLKSIRNALKNNLEEVNNLFEAGKGKYNTLQEKQFIEDTYNDCKSISIDYGVMEKANNVYVVSASFGWSDLGTWTSLYLQSSKDEEQNVISGTTSLHNVKNSIVRAPREKLTVLGDLDGYLVVDTEDVLMVCKFDDENNFKQIVNNALLNSGNDKA